MALDSILEIKDLQVSINENEILKFELKVNRGEIHAIMGPNGSGKVLFKSSCRSPTYSISNGDIFSKAQVF
jgi:Fe-S cluster assembly ATP-binding protein